ncbi:unnamed protein product [Prorocentrum cordatum]|uniref:Uncharacterized protein n=1 Tax=Prorocentrum cordatum TaxID=2364126 RepID=A0ABN9WDL8_9DINO|nr:unnamed protein product [Polarella glacialis]
MAPREVPGGSATVCEQVVQALGQKSDASGTAEIRQFLAQDRSEVASEASRGHAAASQISPLVVARGRLDTLCEQVVRLQTEMADSADRSRPATSGHATPVQATPQRALLSQFASEATP